MFLNAILHLDKCNNFPLCAQKKMQLAFCPSFIVCSRIINHVIFILGSENDSQNVKCQINVALLSHILKSLCKVKFLQFVPVKKVGY